MALNPTKYQVQLRDTTGKLIKILTPFITSANLQWEWDRIGGCGPCTMTLAMPWNVLANYIGPNYDLQIWLEDTSGIARLFYRGYCESYEPILQVNDQVNLSFSGYAGQLKRIYINQTYNGMEVSAIVKSILDNYIVPNTGITYNIGDLWETDFSVDTIVFDGLADSVMTTLANLGVNVEWGVDYNKNFFFKSQNSIITQRLKVGQNLIMNDPIFDYSVIINQINLKGGQVNGVDFTDIIDSTESQAAYGLRSSVQSNSAIISSAVSQQYGAQLLANSARITMRSTIDITKNKTMFESTIPLGAFSILTQPVPLANKYGSGVKYGTGIKYGGASSFQAERITYTIADEGTDVEIIGGSPVPDVAALISRLQAQINQLV